MKMRDQPQFPFIMEELKIPVLPGRFCAIVKRENILPEHIALHASGHPSGNSLKQYTDAVDRVLRGDKGLNTEISMRCHVLSRLILSYSENPAHPIGAEVGIFKGENAINLLNIFPGLKLHCIDNRQPMGAEKKYPDAENIWNNISSKYSNRIVNYTCNSTEAKINEPLDYVFIDADHRTDSVIKDIEYYLPFIKPGGFIAGHDINRKGTYYSNTSVKEAVEKVFGNNFQTGADYTWYHIKK
jgi:predicted O-methyltransferase YrrM